MRAEPPALDYPRPATQPRQMQRLYTWRKWQLAADKP